MMKKFLTSKEAAEYLSVSEIALQEMVDNSKIPSYKIGGIYTRFKVDDLDQHRGKAPKGNEQSMDVVFIDKVKDFFYFNDFYIFSGIAVLIILYFIFR